MFQMWEQSLRKESMTVYMKVCTGALLAAAGYQDLRTRKISISILWCFAAVSGVLHIAEGGYYLQRGAAGALLGAAVLLVGKITKESVGYGDGFLLCLTGLNIGFSENIALFLSALCFCALYGGMLLILRRAGRKKTVPFVPFMALAYLIQNMAGGL